jgi:hypothetical protein
VENGIKPHRLLLGSTALVSAGVLLTGATPARADIEVVLSGYTEFGAIGATDETLNSSGGDRGYTFFMDNEIRVQANGTTERGLKYGSYIAMEIGSGSSPGTQGAPGNSIGLQTGPDQAGEVYVDEANLFFADGFGRVELGRQDGAEDVMFVGGADAQSGTGGIDGDTANLASVIGVQTSGDTTKATYFTPRLVGFQLGASYSTDSNDAGGLDNIGGFAQLVGVGANWSHAFGGVALTVAAVGSFGSADNENTQQGGGLSGDDIKDYSIGALVAVGGLSFGIDAGQRTDFNETDFANLGLKFKFGAASASVGYTYADVNNLNDTQHVFAVSGDMGLMPGVVLKGDVTYNSEDPGAGDSNGAEQNDTWSGVLSVQMDY